MEKNEDISQLRERIALTEQTAKAAHTRIDQLDRIMREDIKELKEEVNSKFVLLSADMKIVLAFLERWKGMIAVITIGAGFFGWVVQQIIGLMFHTK